MPWTRDEMAARAAAELRDGEYVNLGIGLPTLSPTTCRPAPTSPCTPRTASSASGPFPYDDDVDPDLINAGQADGHGASRVRRTSTPRPASR